MKKAMFFVGDRPYAVWDPNIHEKNVTFLKNFDTSYFEYLADIHSSQIDLDTAQQAATALRTSYGLGIETFFSLLGAAMQAPECVFGWLDKYVERDITHIINSIMGKEKLRTRLVGVLSWESLSRTLHRNLVLADKEEESAIKNRFAGCWKYLAENYLNKEQKYEFNGAKHGMRLQPGGIHISIGQQSRLGVPAPPERMERVPGSKFGAAVLRLEQIGRMKHDYRVKEISRNWDLYCLTGLIRIVSMSINNIISFLLIQNGQDPTFVRFIWPEDLQDFDKIWEASFALSGVTWKAVIDEKDIKVTQAEDVELRYLEKCSGSVKA